MTTTRELRRLPDWQDRLATYVRCRSKRAFAWAVHDCVQFALGDVQAVTGTGLHHRVPAYACRRTAAAGVRAHGGLHELGLHVFGPDAPPAFATHGDIGLIQWPPDGPSLRAFAVSNGGTWFAVGRQQLELLPSHAALRCWKVG